MSAVEMEGANEHEVSNAMLEHKNLTRATEVLMQLAF